MRALTELFAAGFRRGVRYRMAIITSFFTNAVFGLIRGSLLIAAVKAGGGDIHGYDALTAATFVWAGQGLLGPIDVWGSSTAEIGQRIKSGQFAIDLLRPVNPVAAWAASDLGRAASQLLPRFVPMLLVGWLVTGIRLTTSPACWVGFVVALVLAVLASHLFFSIVNLSALWWIDIRGQRIVAWVVAQVFSGFLVPVQWFPGWAATIARWSPFPSMWQTPVDMLTGLAAGRVWSTVVVQVAWVVALFALANLVLRLGARKLEVQGG